MSILAKQFLLAAMLIYLVFKNSSIKEHFSSLHNPEKLNSAPLLKGDAVAVNKRKEPQTCYLRDQNSNVGTKLNCSLADFKSLGNPKSSLPPYLQFPYLSTNISGQRPSNSSSIAILSGRDNRIILHKILYVK